MHDFLNVPEAVIKFGLNSVTDTLPTPERLLQWNATDYRSGRRVIDDQ
jgi:hypothetical protein